MGITLALCDGQKVRSLMFMRTKSMLGSVVVSLMLIGGCEKASDQQQKVNTAQNEANDKIVEASKEAQQKVNSAQADADKKIAEAQAKFMKLREDYRHDVSQNLIDLDKKVAEMEAKALKEKAKVKDELETRAKQVRAQRVEFEKHVNDLETATADTWDGMKAKLDKEWDDLKTLANK